MSSQQPNLLCFYGYDPLDRLIYHTQTGTSRLQRFYCNSRLATEIQGAMQQSILQHDDHLLAQHRLEGGASENALLATDKQRSVLNAIGATETHHRAYTPYGHLPPENGLLSLLGFNGERPDPVTGHYHLGNGYRQYNPVLMRFNSPDSLSPFGMGGFNAYAYCEGDPQNWSDETGHGRVPFTAVKNVVPKRSAMRVPNNSRAISKPVSVSVNTQAVMNVPGDMVQQELRKKATAAGALKHRQKIKAIVETITKNEASGRQTGKYNVSDHPPSYKYSEQAYKVAQEEYGFVRYPDPKKFRTWQDPQGNVLLDVAHFDAAVSYYKHRHYRVGGAGYLRKVTILRAEYIKKFTGIDLMAVRQG